MPAIYGGRNFYAVNFNDDDDDDAQWNNIVL